MASENVLEYGDYEYDWTYEYDWEYWYNYYQYWYNYYKDNYDWTDYGNDYNWTSRMDNPNARNDSMEGKMENILAKIVDCNYILREDEKTGTETRNQTMNKEDSIKRVNQKSVCDIEDAELKEAMKYVQAGFQIPQSKSITVVQRICERQ